MENASKALLIAGAVLIGVLILAVGVYVISNLQTVNTSYDKSSASQEAIKFNQRILKNLGTNSEGTYTATAQQVVTIKNLLEEVNHKYIVIETNVDDIIVEDDYLRYLQENSNNKYNVTIEYSEGLISRIDFLNEVS